MSKDPAADQSLSVTLPGPVSEWLSLAAAERNTTEEQLLRDLVAAHRSVDEENLGGRLERFEDETNRKIQDVRERIIQLKRETDGKADADHGHEELEGALGEVATRIEETEERLGEFEETLSDVDERVTGGFENYEEILEYLTDTADDNEEKLKTLATAVMSLREQTHDMAEALAMRSAAAQLARTANRHGIQTAKCEDCKGTVNVGLLSEPTCPHCSAQFEELDAKRGFFRSDVLRTGTPPAIEGAVPDEEPDLTDIAEEGGAGI